jgi:hypothetical protein
MLHVTSLQVRSYDLDHLDLFWEIPATDDVVADYSFYVERSIDGGAGPYKQIAGPFINTYIFRDAEIRAFHKWRDYFYRLKVVNNSTGDQQVSDPATLQAAPDLITLEIRRREALLFKEFAGRLIILFPSLTWGQRCRHCWDGNARGNTIGRSTQQNCVSCFDTTFVGGYATPMLIPMQIDPSPKAHQPADIGEQHYIETTARTGWFPPIKPKDLIIEAENKRWGVKSSTPTEKLRAPIRQELQLRQYPKDDIRYKVPVLLDLLKQMSPEREFKRLMDLQEDINPPRAEVVIK